MGERLSEVDRLRTNSLFVMECDRSDGQGDGGLDALDALICMVRKRGREDRKSSTFSSCRISGLNFSASLFGVVAAAEVSLTGFEAPSC